MARVHLAHRREKQRCLVPQKQREVLEALVQEAGRSYVQCKTTNSGECEANMYSGGGVDHLLHSPSNPFQSLWLQGLIGPLGLELPPIPLSPWGPCIPNKGRREATQEEEPWVG